MTRLMITFGLRPAAAMPRYRARRHLAGRHGTGEEGVAPIRPRGREDAGGRTCEDRLHLVAGVAGRGRGGDDLGLERVRGDRPRTVVGAEPLDRRLIEPHHRSKRAGDQVEFVLDHQIGWGQRRIEHRSRGPERRHRRSPPRRSVRHRRAGPPKAPSHGKAANLSTVAIRNAGSLR